MDIGGDVLLALLKEITEYRKSIMKSLCSDQLIVDLMTNNTTFTLPCRKLIYNQIFPYAHTPETTKETKTFICFRITVPEVYNKTYKQMGIVFYVFTHESLIRTDNGLRTDLIAERIDTIFNGNLDIGLGRLQLMGIDDISPTIDYHGVAIEYAVDEYNRPTINGSKR